MNHTCKVCTSQNVSIYRYNDHQNLRTKALVQFFIIKLICFATKYLSQKIYEKYYFKLIFSPLYKITKCNDCGYGYYEKYLSNTTLSKYYNNLYWQASGLKDSKVFENHFFLDDKRSNAQHNFISEFIKQRGSFKMLEIGAASALISRFIRHHQSSEVEIDVVEAGTGWIEYYKVLNINQVSNFFPFKSEKKYDYIHTSHWLEHVGNLEEVILQLNDLLNPNGLLFVEVPNCIAYFELDYIDTPHIHFFTQKSMSKLFSSHGFEVLKFGEYGLTMAETLKLKNNQTLESGILESAKESELKGIERKDGSNLRFIVRKIG